MNMLRNCLFYSLVLITVSFSCSDDVVGPVLKIGASPEFTAPAANSSFVLKESEAAKSFATFSWTAADYGFQAGVNYSLEMALTAEKFKEPIVLGSVNELSLITTIGKINSVIIAKGRPGGEPVSIEFRIAANVNPDVPTIYSKSLVVNVTPYEAVIDYPKLQVPGSYQGWNPADQKTVIFSAKSDGKYEGYVFMNQNAEFKYTVGPSWDLNYGDDGGDGSLDKGGANIKATKEGIYKLNVNINTLKHERLQTSWGIIGSATPNGWDSDQDLIYDATTNTLKITLNLKVGDIKFRANDDWGINLGDDGANRSLEYGGANIGVAAEGRYSVELFLNKAIYSYKLTKI
ncbi:MAG: hypothetical protein RLZZ417_2278 [Bacteroidota bacterium]|jgi:hypothetical protein